MKDMPCIVLAATVWAYWICVGAMIVRVRRRTRKLSGIVPSSARRAIHVGRLGSAGRGLGEPSVSCCNAIQRAVGAAGFRSGSALPGRALGRCRRGHRLPGAEHRMLAAHGQELAHRGHGDLLADDVFCLPDGPRILDCLEFDDTLRYGDVLADVAFLAMDLEWLERPDLASALLDGYRRRRGDTWPASLAHFYVAYRALVRAKVAGLRAAERPRRRGVRQRAPRPRGRAPPPRARAPRAHRRAHRRRARRRRRASSPGSRGGRCCAPTRCARSWPGCAPESSAAAPLDEGLYSPEWSDRTYTALLERARARLGMGESVILDASWSERDRRDAAGAAARATASELSRVRVRGSRSGSPANARTGGPGKASTRRMPPRRSRGPCGSDSIRGPTAVAVDTSEPPELVARRIARTLAVSMPD